MPKIIKNGVTYIGTSDNAAAVTYNNTSSGLNATDVQGAIDEVVDNKMDKVNPTGSGNFSFNATSTVGWNNVNLCLNGRASGTYNFVCGAGNHAGGQCNLIGGYDNSVSGTANIVGGYDNSVSEVTVTDDQGEERTYFPNYNAVFGNNNTVNGGSYNIVAGYGSAIGIASYCSLFGYGLKASGNHQHLMGRWNKESKTALEVVGWGSSDSNRANVRTLSVNGDEVLAGIIEAQGLGNTLKQAVIDAIYSVLPLRNGHFNNANPLVLPIPSNATYGVYIILGFFQGIGSVLLDVRISNGTISKIYNLRENTVFSSQSYSFTYSKTTGLTITTTFGSNSYYTALYS